MGGCASSLGGGEMLIVDPDGDMKTFHERFIEEDVLGEGEFGVVKRVFETSNPKVPLACKTLKKGMVFKDNNLYPALPPEMLRGEIEILRAVRGKENFCLQLHSIYESPKAILMVTEICAGGEMMEYVAKQDSDLRTEDVSRISFQLLSAIDCCAKKSIIHRDIKPGMCETCQLDVAHSHESNTAAHFLVSLPSISQTSQHYVRNSRFQGGSSCD